MDYTVYMEAAGENSILLRGASPVTNVIRTPNDGSTFFAYSADFEIGNLMFRHKNYYHLLLNLNAELDELYLKDPEKGTWLLLNKNFVDFFYLGDRKFIHHRPLVNQGLPYGYYEELYTGNVKLYKKSKRIYYQGLNTRGEMQRGFALSQSYYLWKEAKWTIINKQADLKKIYKNQKNELNSVIREVNHTFRKNREQLLIEVVSRLDQ